jgi:hypothetical protein
MFIYEVTREKIVYDEFSESVLVADNVSLIYRTSTMTDWNNLQVVHR